MKKSLALAASLALLAPAAFAASELDFAQSLQPAFHALSDGRYKLVEKKAKQALDILKTLRGYSGEVKDRAEGLRKELLGNRYDDLSNTRLTPELFEAKSNNETIRKTYGLEKDNVGKGLKAAKAGDYAAIDAALARVNAFENEYEGKTKANAGRIAAVRADYEKDFGAAKAALAQFEALPLVAELSAAKPRLVKDVKLEPASLRPLRWTIVLRKENKDYNDPRFSQLPRDTAGYEVIVR